MPTVSDFLNAAGTVLLCNAVIFLVGRAMRASMKRKGQHLRAYHGWYVWVWMMGGVALGGVLLPWNTNTLSQYRGAPLLIGFLAGWLGGFFHGLRALQQMKPSSPADETPSA